MTLSCDQMKVAVISIFLAFTALFATSCTQRQVDVEKAQQTIDHLIALQEPHKYLDELIASDKWKPKKSNNPTPVLRSEFQVDTILPVFPNLHMKPGTTLDFVYYLSDMGGWPVLYARQAGTTPFGTFAELTNAMPQAQARGRSTNTWSQGFGFYLDSIRADGTADSYFQLLALYLMGDQFFHIWHDGYHDERLICTKSGLDDLFQEDSQITDSRRRIPDDVKSAAYALQLSPQVKFQRDTVLVSVVIFTKWGGFQQRTYTISRRFPHRLMDEQRQELVSYSCGYVI